MLFTASPAFASDYIRDFDWPNIDCWRISDIVNKLQGLADYLQQKADEARANGLEGLADAFESAAAEAEIAAAEGTFHLSTGDCVS